MNGPLPTTQVFLSQIPELEVGSKIRFLGCVAKYDVSRGVLTLEHNYSQSKPQQSDRSRSRFPRNAVDVDINLLLESVSHTDLQVGVWLNVLGYVRHQGAEDGTTMRSKRSRPPMTLRNATGEYPIYIEAIIAFSAGSIHVGEYERVLQDAQDADKRLNRAT